MLCGEERGGVMWSPKRGEGGRRWSSSSSSLRCPCAPSPVRTREKASICSSSSGGGGCPLPQPRQLRRSEGNSFGFSPSTLSSGQQRKKVPPSSLSLSFSVSLPFHPLTIWCRCFLELSCYHSQNVSICQCYVESVRYGVVNCCYLNNWLAMIFGHQTKSAQNTHKSVCKLSMKNHKLMENDTKRAEGLKKFLSRTINILLSQKREGKLNLRHSTLGTDAKVSRRQLFEGWFELLFPVMGPFRWGTRDLINDG